MHAAVMLATVVHAQERRAVPEFHTYGKPADAGDASAIQILIQQYWTSWKQQDSEGLGRLHAEDVEWINAYARLIRGAAPLAEFLKTRLFPGFDPEVSAAEAANMRLISLRYIGETGAVVHMYTEGQRGPSRNDSETLRRTHIHLVLEKRANWLIVHTAVMDAR